MIVTNEAQTRLIKLLLTTYVPISALTRFEDTVNLIKTTLVGFSSCVVGSNPVALSMVRPWGDPKALAYTSSVMQPSELLEAIKVAKVFILSKELPSDLPQVATVQYFSTTKMGECDVSIETLPTSHPMNYSADNKGYLELVTSELSTDRMSIKAEVIVSGCTAIEQVGVLVGTIEDIDDVHVPKLGFPALDAQSDIVTMAPYVTRLGNLIGACEDTAMVTLAKAHLAQWTKDQASKLDAHLPYTPPKDWDTFVHVLFSDGSVKNIHGVGADNLRMGIGNGCKRMDMGTMLGAIPVVYRTCPCTDLDDLLDGEGDDEITNLLKM